MSQSHSILLAACVLAVASLSWPADAEARPPNVVLIMADDLGYRDLGCYGHPSIQTPVLDRLAADGIRLTSFYAGATVCTPSRMALLTGAYPTRLGWTRGVVGYMMGLHAGMHADALTMAEVFKAAGYATGISGKWHLGDRAGSTPHAQGFDSAYYISRSNNQTKKLWRKDELLENPFDNRLLTQKFATEAVRFIRTHKNEPFLLYVPFTAPHFPVQPHPDWKGKSRFGEYGDVVEELDARIGEILGALEDESIADRTIVVFLSDNGPQPGEKADAHPFRGMKWSVREGGTRVPCVIRWPGRIPAGTESDALIAAIDLLPTLCSACGVELAKISQDRPVIDGVDVLPTFTGKATDPHPRTDLLYWHGRHGFQAIRVGEWKLYLDRRHADLDGAGRPALINLAEDPGEQDDLSERYPERVEAMTALAKQRLDEIQANVLPLSE